MLPFHQERPNRREQGERVTLTGTYHDEIADKPDERVAQQETQRTTLLESTARTCRTVSEILEAHRSRALTDNKTCSDSPTELFEQSYQIFSNCLRQTARRTHRNHGNLPGLEPTVERVVCCRIIELVLRIDAIWVISSPIPINIVASGSGSPFLSAGAERTGLLDVDFLFDWSRHGAGKGSGVKASHEFLFIYHRVLNVYTIGTQLVNMKRAPNPAKPDPQDQCRRTGSIVSLPVSDSCAKSLALLRSRYVNKCA